MILVQSYNRSFTSPPNWFHISAQLRHYFHNIIEQICIKEIHPDRPDCLPASMWIQFIRLQRGEERVCSALTSPGSLCRRDCSVSFSLYNILERYKYRFQETFQI